MIISKLPMRPNFECRLVGLLIFLIVAIFCNGCGDTNAVLGGWDKAELERQVLSFYKSKDGKNSKDISCTLVQDSPNKYHGFISLEMYMDDQIEVPSGDPNGGHSIQHRHFVESAQQPITVTTDKDTWISEASGPMVLDGWRQQGNAP